MPPYDTQSVPFETDVIDRLARIEEHMTTSAASSSDHETRIRSMEKRQWLLAGAAAAFGPMLTKLGLHMPSIG